jgi:hypothetical protein
MALGVTLAFDQSQSTIVWCHTHRLRRNCRDGRCAGLPGSWEKVRSEVVAGGGVLLQNRPSPVYVFTCRAMDTLVSDTLFPVTKKEVFFTQRLEAPALQSE